MGEYVVMPNQITMINEWSDVNYVFVIDQRIENKKKMKLFFQSKILERG